jgi:hypothetical protein
MPTEIGVDSGKECANGRGDESVCEMSSDEIGEDDDENIDEDDHFFIFSYGL